MYTTVHSQCSSPTCFSLPAPDSTSFCTYNDGNTANSACPATKISVPGNCNTCRSCPAGTAKFSSALKLTTGATSYINACFPPQVENSPAVVANLNPTPITSLNNYDAVVPANSSVNCASSAVPNQDSTACVECPSAAYVKYATLVWPNSTYTSFAGERVKFWRFYCQNCPLGTWRNPSYAPFSENDQPPPCLSCPMGSYSNVSGEACKQCPAGLTSAGPLSVSATSNPLPTFGVTSCFSCPTGRYRTSPNTCSNCPLGRYVGTAGASVCLLCNPTTEVCPPGTTMPIPVDSIPGWNNRNNLPRQSVPFTLTPAYHTLSNFIASTTVQYLPGKGSVNPSSFVKINDTSVFTFDSPDYQDAHQKYFDDLSAGKTNIQLLCVIYVCAIGGFVLLVLLLTQCACVPASFSDRVRLWLQSSDSLFDTNHYISLGHSPKRLPSPLGGLASITVFFAFAIILSTSLVDFYIPTTYTPGAVPKAQPFPNPGTTAFNILFYGYVGSCKSDFSISDSNAYSGIISQTSTLDSKNSICKATIRCRGCVFNSNVKMTLSSGGRAIAASVTIESPGYSDQKGSTVSPNYISSNYLYINDLSRTLFDENTFSFNYVKSTIVSAFGNQYSSAVYQSTDVKSGFQEQVYDNMDIEAGLVNLNGLAITINLLVSPLTYELMYTQSSVLVLLSSILSLLGSAIATLGSVMGFIESCWWERQEADSSKDTQPAFVSRLVRNVSSPKDQSNDRPQPQVPSQDIELDVRK